MHLFDWVSSVLEAKSRWKTDIFLPQVILGSWVKEIKPQKQKQASTVSRDLTPEGFKFQLLPALASVSVSEPSSSSSSSSCLPLPHLSWQSWPKLWELICIQINNSLAHRQQK